MQEHSSSPFRRVQLEKELQRFSASSHSEFFAALDLRYAKLLSELKKIIDA